MHNSSYSVLECCDFNQVPSHDYLFDLLDKVTTVLEQEITEYRPADSNGNPGGLLILDKDIPSVIVPDIHARPNFIKNILNYSLPKRFFHGSDAEVKKDNILSLLEQNNSFLQFTKSSKYNNRNATIYIYHSNMKSHKDVNICKGRVAMRLRERKSYKSLIFYCNW